MKTTLLSILLCAHSIIASMAGADEENRDQPRPEEKPREELRQRLQAEKARFHEEVEQRLKSAMEDAARLDAEGKKDAAEELRLHAKDAAHDALLQHERAMEAGRREHRETAREEHEGQNRAEIERRLKHVREAIGHLREADLPEPAENLERIAQRLQASLQAEAGSARPDEGRRHADLDALRAEIAELRQAVRRLAAKQGEH